MSKKNMVEKKFESSIIATLNRKGILNKKNLGGNMQMNGFTISQQKGWPDLMIFYNENTIFIEFKTDTGALEVSQQELFPKLLESGFEVYIARPSHYEKYKETIKRGQFNIYDFVSYCELFSEYYLKEKENE